MPEPETDQDLWPQIYSLQAEFLGRGLQVGDWWWNHAETLERFGLEETQLAAALAVIYELYLYQDLAGLLQWVPKSDQRAFVAACSGVLPPDVSKILRRFFGLRREEGEAPAPDKIGELEAELWQASSATGANQPDLLMAAAIEFAETRCPSFCRSARARAAERESPSGEDDPIEGVTDDLVNEAKVEFKKALKRKRARGHEVKIVKSPYHEGLSNVRSVLEVDGVEQRLFFHKASKRWRLS